MAVQPSWSQIRTLTDIIDFDALLLVYVIADSVPALVKAFLE